MRHEVKQRFIQGQWRWAVIDSTGEAVHHYPTYTTAAGVCNELNSLEVHVDDAASFSTVALMPIREVLRENHLKRVLEAREFNSRAA